MSSAEAEGYALGSGAGEGTLHLCGGKRVGSGVEVGSTLCQYGHNITAFENGSWSHETRRASFLIRERTKVLDVNTHRR